VLKRSALILACLLPVLAAQPAAGSGTLHEPPWSWPLEPQPRVLGHFDPPPQPWASGHRGVDLGPADGSREGVHRAGPAVLSPAAGRVVFVGFVVDRPVVTVDHGDGLVSSFEPVTAEVVPGERVPEGGRIGALGDESHCPVRCLHWGVRLDGRYVNPLNYVSDRRPSVLLPFEYGAHRAPEQ
jgi:murein DD-endopeptidase MepM/ murein hydrolase activator NlpD